MAINVLPSKGSWGNILGTGLSEGLQQGIQGLAQAKINQMKKGHYEQALATLQNPNASREQKLAAIPNLPDYAQKLVLPNLPKLLGGGEGEGGNIFEDPERALKEKKFARETEQYEERKTLDQLAPWIKGLNDEKLGVNAEKIYELGDEFLDLIETGKTGVGETGISGAWKAYAPTSKLVLNPETIRARNIANQLLELGVQSTQGKQSQMLIQLMKDAKLNLEQGLKPTVANASKMMESAGKALSLREAWSDVNEELGGKVPSNIKQIVERRADEIYANKYENKIKNKTAEVKFSFMPDAKKARIEANALKYPEYFSVGDEGNNDGIDYVLVQDENGIKRWAPKEEVNGI